MYQYLFGVCLLTADCSEFALTSNFQCFTGFGSKMNNQSDVPAVMLLDWLSQLPILMQTYS